MRADPTAGAVKLHLLVCAERLLDKFLDSGFSPQLGPDLKNDLQLLADEAPGLTPAVAQAPAQPAKGGSEATAATDSQTASRRASRAASVGMPLHYKLIEQHRVLSRSVLMQLPGPWGEREAAAHSDRLRDAEVVHALYLEGTLNEIEYAQELGEVLTLADRSAAVVRVAKLRRVVALADAAVLSPSELAANKLALLEVDSTFSALGHVRAPAEVLRPKNSRELYLAAQLHALQPREVGGLVGAPGRGRTSSG
ncbi:hypothetical protein T492DRAFT_956169 [Pavlovales sp. CCMP2436]|nr:hypothetical protein T492DRAFT_956169 [Pavlovales sp. CCMP2436]|mmetsp:Transcript_349/g.1005  ORF Transcript_349/g.1005 Transcript_349/m.1005 type:complete len:253 (+) Transcript_349:726-1484(+)